MSTYTFKHEYIEETKTVIIDCATQADIDSFEYPEGVEDVSIYGDHIDSVVIPDGVKYVTLCRMGLKRVTLPDSVLFFYCNNNLLKNIELPKDVEIVELKRNLLESVTFRGGSPARIGILKLSDNLRLRKLDFDPPDTLEVLKLKRCYGLEYMHPKIKALNPVIWPIGRGT